MYQKMMIRRNKMIITGNITKTILFDPILAGADKLLILSSYASPNMASWYMKQLQERKTIPIEISLIIGMTAYDGISIYAHKGFVSLHNKYTSKSVRSFNCSYIFENPPIHSNVYIWLKQNKPETAFLGSADFTQSAFISSRQEIMEECFPSEALDYYNKAESRSCYCNHSEIDDMVIIRNHHPILDNEKDLFGSISCGAIESVQLPLLTNKGIVAEKSGLNWGQREKRNPNEAYIRIPITIAKKNFFPLNRHFTVLTDDGKTLILRVEQQDNKALTTPMKNSLLGEYFRNRLKLPNGHRIVKEDLERHGRTDVVFAKIDDELYYMDFSPNKIYGDK